jgi:hypothetical protein
MTEYITRFSFSVKNLTDEEMEYLAHALDVHSCEEDPSDPCDFYGDIIKDTRTLWIHDCGECSGDIESAVGFLRQFLFNRRPNQTVLVSWANTSNKPEEDAFNGGAVIVTAHDELWFNAVSLAQEYSRTKKCEPYHVLGHINPDILRG